MGKKEEFSEMKRDAIRFFTLAADGHRVNFVPGTVLGTLATATTITSAIIIALTVIKLSTWR